MKRKNLLMIVIVFALISLNNFLNAQAPNWEWARSSGGISDDEGMSIAVDGSGNRYVTGYFHSSTITFGTTTLTNNGTGTTEDMFIVKYDPNGNVLWAKSAGGSGFDWGHGIAVDSSGNSYVTGYLGSSPITFGSIILTNPGMFIAKYNANGNVVWAKSAGGSDNDYGNSIAVDDSGNSYVIGSYASSTITFGTTTLTNDSAGLGDIFVVKYDSSGNV